MCNISVYAVCKSKITTLFTALFTQRDHKNHIQPFCQFHTENSCSVAFHSLVLKNLYQLDSDPPITSERLFIFSSIYPCMAFKSVILQYFFLWCPSPILKDGH